ncbi:MAG: right-handed parallel beta-helix repeat-containing protein [Gemmatimonadota bacterium]
MARPTRSAAGPVAIYVATDGDDRWPGHLPRPNRAGTDGPLASPRAAQRAVRRLGRRGAAGPIEVRLRGGTYYLSSPLVFTAADTAPPADEGGRRPGLVPPTVTWKRSGRGQPVLSAGRRLTGWRQTTVNGCRAWVADLPAIRRGAWWFQQLWVSGERRHRPRLPREGFHRIDRLVGVTARTPYHQGQDSFVYRPGDLDPTWHNLRDVEVVTLSYWTESRLWIRRADGRRRRVYFDRVSSKRLTDDFAADRPTEYYVENVFEALTEPGQWYLDRPAGQLYYLPLPGERPYRTEVVAPVHGEVVRLAGTAQRPVARLAFEGIQFSHNQWFLPADKSNVGQASHQIPGAVTLCHAADCTFRDCAVSHVGSYGVELAGDCTDVGLDHCAVTDLGAGGVKVWHGCRRNTVTDCEIADGGILYPSAVGVLIGRSSGSKLTHCHIHHFYYTGISVGWTWGYAESEAYGNLVEHNHVHHIGQGYLSDLGGIYTLGVSPGTRIRHNVFHDIVARGYGGWAIYTDEGSTDILIESNLSYRTNRSPFHQHYGRDNEIRNNIWVCGRESQLALTRLEGHCSFHFHHNIVYFEAGELFASRLGEAAPEHVDLHHNLYWRAGGRRFRFGRHTFRQWQQQGHDRGSRVADPRFVAPGRDDYALRPGCPALALGFLPLDLSGVGPRPR